MYRNIKISTGLLFYFILALNGMTSKAQSIHRQDSSQVCNAHRSKFEIGAEYLTPTRFVNQIKTISFHGFFWRKRFDEVSIKMSAGLICTYAWGISSQYDVIGDTLLLITNYRNSAFGAGPVFQMDPTIIRIKRFSVIAEANGGVILYNKKFPYGGDIYNFIFRAGPSLEYKINKTYSFRMGYRWMHVSNGQGVGNQNPFYEAYGFSVSFLTFQ